ncbi:MAG TPA: sulfite exporter TauE/SafE family protein [Gemmatimonadaceae bacterium]
MDLGTLTILAGAGFVAGAINAVAGGGSLISFPALLAAGYPAITANVTNTVAVWPGTVGGSLAYYPELRGQRRRIIVLGIVSVVGAIVGAALLLASPAQLFERIVPFLILGSCVLLAVQDRLGMWLRSRRAKHTGGSLSVPLLVAHFVASVYGAYFVAGLGILVLAFLGIFLRDDLQRLNALKGLLSVFINGVSAAYFALFGPLVWPVAAVMAVASWIGGYLGVSLARRLSPTVLRLVVLAFGVIVALRMLL